MQNMWRTKYFSTHQPEINIQIWGLKQVKKKRKNTANSSIVYGFLSNRGKSCQKIPVTSYTQEEILSIMEKTMLT